jgi:ribosomal protein S18 acetylase RimI-like enzyme
MIEYKIIDKNEKEETFKQVETMLKEMYHFLEGKGLKLTLKEHGEEALMKSIKKMLNTINFIAIAHQNEEVVGFGHANIRLIPEYLEGDKIGFVTHLYVQPSYRKRGVASKLLHILEEQLKKNGINIIELEILVQNIGAIQFWESEGYKKELFLMHKKLS